MDRLALDVVQIQYGQHTYRALGILINGERIEDLARVVEKPHAVAENNPKLAGDYAPLALSDIDSDRNHFLGHPVATWFEDGDTVLMGCPCGEWGCWPLTVRVEVNSSTVRWHGFRNGHREWDLSALGPFEFDRPEYEAALKALA
ncbi:hypothetical protein [Jiangella alkaliphila]|uniref:Uncharacterized protein n=1 Tax=Jiangella alkaliphila TaxID=419479 RepID=A0A1H2KJG9_9ACTN|nr:hypothetical protein [Jiangella alkaliphila]SDU68804.1 hypothetical protein SAMN04488563_3906 [Jiangella alkaliphila]